MFDNMDSSQIAVFGAAIAVALGVGFAGGTLSSSGDASPTGNVAAADAEGIESDVTDFLNTVSGGMADITVNSVEESEFNGLYAVSFTVTADTPQGQQEQESTVYVTEDGQNIFLSQPMDLQNPPEPQARPAPQPAPEQ